MHPLVAKLVRAGVTVTDGAWGTQLQARGLAIGEFPDIWNLLHPERVGAVAESYVEAGSQVILTNTFGANRLRLAGHNLAERIKEINRQGVEISVEAAKGRALVFASVGPTGKLLITGETTEDELQSAFEEQTAALAEAGADALVIETMAEMTEAVIATRAARRTGLPVIACMVFDAGKDRDRTAMGVTIPQAVAALTDAGADVIGANCGQGIAGFVPICARLRAATDLPIWLKANAGMPELVNGRAVYRTTPEAFASHVPELVAGGANFVGGCCGTNPFFVRALLQKVRGSDAA
ncbi:MAG: homocysteine S-methyltransferase family protein [Verrucomicrobiota bacterium]